MLIFIIFEVRNQYLSKFNIIDVHFTDVKSHLIVGFLSLQNPEYMKENFFIKIESLHKADRGDTENVSYFFNL